MLHFAIYIVIYTLSCMWPEINKDTVLFFKAAGNTGTSPNQIVPVRILTCTYEWHEQVVSIRYS